MRGKGKVWQTRNYSLGMSIMLLIVIDLATVQLKLTKQGLKFTSLFKSLIKGPSFPFITEQYCPAYIGAW